MKTKTVICTTIINDTSDEKEMIDWSQILTNLHIKDKLINIARRVHGDEKNLSNLKSGVIKEPKFSVGIQLLALHGLACSQQHKAMNLG